MLKIFRKLDRWYDRQGIAVLVCICGALVSFHAFGLATIAGLGVLILTIDEGVERIVNSLKKE